MSRWLVAVPGVGLLALLAVVAARMGEADALTWSSAARMERWEKKRIRPALEPWMAVRTDLERASRLAPADPVAREFLGVLHLSRAPLPEYAELAQDHFLRSLERRPSSPYTWANVAEARYRLGRSDAPFETVLLTAWRLGPSEPEVQRTVINLGFARWAESSPALQSAVTSALAAAMRRNPLETMQIAERRGRLDLACPFVAGDKRLKQSKWVQACGV
jgi:hypothetical protein